MLSHDPLLPRRYKNHSVGQGKFLPHSIVAAPRFSRDSVDPTPTARRKGFPFGLVLLLAVMGIYATYISGNLPQADALFKSGVKSVRDNNDAVVNSILSSGQLMLIGAGAVMLMLMLFIWRNNGRRRQSESED